MSYDFSFYPPGNLMKHRISQLSSATKAAALAASLVLSLVVSTQATAQAQLKPPAQAPAAAPAKPLSVNGKTIPNSRIDFVVKQNTANGQPDNEQLRRAVTDRMVNTEILAQEAEK